MWQTRCLQRSLKPRSAILCNTVHIRSFSTSHCSRTVYKSELPPVEVPSLPFTDYILENTAAKEDRVAFVDDTNRSFTYAELKERTMDLAIHFHIRGWKKQAVIALFMPNVFEWVLTFFSAAKAGMIITPVPTSAIPSELENQLKDSKATYIITTQALLPVVREVTASLRGIKEVLVLDKDTSDIPKTKEGYIRYTNEMKYNLLFAKPPAWGSLPDWEVNPDDPVLLPYTPSASALPKAVVLTHRNLVASVAQSLPALQHKPEDVVSTTVPFHRVFGVIMPLALQMRVGSTVFLSSNKPQEVIPLLQSNNVTHAYLQPSDVEEIANSNAAGLAKSVTILATSNSKEQASDAVSSDTVKKLQSQIPDLQIRQAWGLTETSSVGTLLSIRDGQDISSVGSLIPNTEAMVVDNRGREVKEVDAEGQVCLKGPQVMAHYLNNNDEGITSKRDDGFLETGYIGKVDPQGRIYLTERKKPKATLPQNE